MGSMVGGDGDELPGCGVFLTVKNVRSKFFKSSSDQRPHKNWDPTSNSWGAATLLSRKRGHTKNEKFKQEEFVANTVLRSRSRWSRNYFGSWSRKFYLINIYCSQFGGC